MRYSFDRKLEAAIAALASFGTAERRWKVIVPDGRSGNTNRNGIMPVEPLPWGGTHM